MIEQEQYHLSMQSAELDTAFGEIRNSQNDFGQTLLDHGNRLTRCEYGLGETARDLDFVQDYSIHQVFTMAWWRLEDSEGLESSLRTKIEPCINVSVATWFPSM